MVSFFRHHVPAATLFQLILEGGLFFLAVIVAATIHQSGPLLQESAVPQAFAFAGLMVSINGALGLYARSKTLATSRLVARMVMAVLVGIPIAYLVFNLVPYGTRLQEALGYTIVLTLLGVVIARIALIAGVNSNLFSYRLLVVGTGAEALAIENALARAPGIAMEVVGFYPLGNSNEAAAVSPRRILSKDIALEEFVERLKVDEVVVAVREQRGGVLPLDQLLGCRLSGVRFTNVAGFIERVGGEVPIDSLKASWLIYGDGFRTGRVSNLVKRIFDILMATLLLAVTLPIMLLAALAIAFEGRGPIIFRQERVGQAGRTFTLLKFRSMCPDAEKDGTPRWASTNDPRVTAVGRFLRRSRIDELPQVFNVLRGHMSFVGPRPERPGFVAQLTEQVPFYAARHCVKPGITGWAQVRYAYGASVEDSMKKLQFDLYYVKNHSLFLDVVILIETVRVVLLGKGAR